MFVLRVGKPSFGCGDNHAKIMRYPGIRAEHTDSGREALEFLRLYDYDLLLMDLYLTDMPGLEAVRTLRAAGFTVPVVMLADAATANATARALDQGVDEFITASCEAEEFLARCRAIIRRSQG